ncbi:MAG TPA: family 1 glycosylhydrolase [Pyrinomonadaceae bacterium]|nr:family 1 glycosylhydrolase [Pyrinomonadaceae bacterium]
MNGIRFSPDPEDFIWASGIEDTFVPQVKPGHRPLDEYQLMGHYVHWREDLALARELGLDALRWGVPWYRVEPQPGEFDWGWTDEVIPYMVEELGITPIIDLMHYGTPFWLTRSFIDKNYPRAVASYSAAFVRRYHSLIKWYTPLNEPLVNSLYCGKRGLWPPYLRGDNGYIRVMLQLVKGIAATVEAVKEEDAQARMVHVEATGLSRAIRQDLEALAVEEQHRGYLAYDLLTGRVRADHPLFTWLVRNGVSADDLQEIAAHPIELDVLGLNFYPQWSTQHLFIDKKGRLAFRPTEDDSAGLAAIINDYHRRYNAPVLITETSAFGSDELRANWLRTSLDAVKFLRSQGVPVYGYTWFPLFTMIDWRYRHEIGPIEQYRLELGLYRLRQKLGSTEEDDGLGRWSSTPLVEQFRSYIADPHAAVGPLIEGGAGTDAAEELFSEEEERLEQPVEGD